MSDHDEILKRNARYRQSLQAFKRSCAKEDYHTALVLLDEAIDSCDDEFAIVAIGELRITIAAKIAAQTRQRNSLTGRILSKLGFSI